MKNVYLVINRLIHEERLGVYDQQITQIIQFFETNISINLSTEKLVLTLFFNSNYFL